MLESRVSNVAPPFSDASVKLRTYFHGVTKLRARIKNCIDRFQSHEHVPTDTVEDYLRAADRLEGTLRGWCDVTALQPRTVNAEARYSVLNKAYTLFTFDNWNAFFLWNRYLVAKTALHAGLLDVLRLISEQQFRFRAAGYATTAELLLQHKTSLEGTLDRFIGAIGYAFGDIDPLVEDEQTRHVARKGSDHRVMNIVGAFQVFQPLVFFTRLEYVTEVQHFLIVEALQMMSAEFRTR